MNTQTNPANRRATRVRSATFLAILVLSSVLVMTGPPAEPAGAATGVAGTAVADPRLFEPGLLISDALFFDARTMNASAIRSFLVEQGVRCTSTSTGICLKDYRVSTPDIAPDSFCAGYRGVANESASQIIAKAAVSCGINPQVILVKLNVEQSLVGRIEPASAAIYDKAMGYACPDFQACNPNYAGFFKQVYYAVRRFKEYPSIPWMKFKARAVADTQYHPNAACGTSPVYIQNQATANLYNYTPYQPNAAILAGTPDPCSSYGNWNFWRFFTEWFGSPTQRLPVGVIDSISAAPVDFTSGSITVAGWALDQDVLSSIAVHIYVDGVGTAVAADRSRPDVDAAYRRGPNKGFVASFTVTAGTHTVCAYAIDGNQPGHTPLGCRRVVVPAVPNRPPVGVVDTAAGVPGGISVAGWAFDPNSPTASIPVHVYIDSAGYALPTNQARADVNAAYGITGTHGYTANLPAAPGPHRVCAYAIDANIPTNTNLGCRTVTV